MRSARLGAGVSRGSVVVGEVGMPESYPIRLSIGKRSPRRFLINGLRATAVREHGHCERLSEGFGLFLHACPQGLGGQLSDLKPSSSASVRTKPGLSDSCGKARPQSSNVDGRCSFERSQAALIGHYIIRPWHSVERMGRSASQLPHFRSLIMAVLRVCREAHSRIIAGVCPWCGRTASNGHIVWQLGTGTEQLNEELPRSHAESSFPLSVRDDQTNLRRLRAMLNDPSEEAQGQATSHLMIFGNKLDVWEAEQLDEYVGQGPEDLCGVRIALIGYYHRKRQTETARSILRGHISWIIENVPESSIAGMLGSFCFAELKDRGEFYDQVKRLWLGVVTANRHTGLPARASR